MAQYIRTGTIGRAVGFTAAALVAVALAGGPARAGETTDEQIQDLRTAQQRLDQQARSTKPAAATNLRREAERLQGLIDALERGEHVDPTALNPQAGRLK